jgi:excisionase family DNA binding protein
MTVRSAFVEHVPVRKRRSQSDAVRLKARGEGRLIRFDPVEIKRWIDGSRYPEGLQPRAGGRVGGVSFMSFAAMIGGVTDRPVDLVFEVAEQDRARLLSVVSGKSDHRVGIRTDAGELELPEAAGLAVLLLLEGLGSGSSVHVVVSDADMTTQQAADLLGLSRTYVIRLIETDKLPARRVGTHRRLRASDVLAYKERRAARLSRVDAIADADREVGVEYR